MQRIKAVFNWSGGKDSAHALWQAMRSGQFRIVALLTTVNGSTRRTTMHGIPLPLLEAQAASIDIPLHIVELTPEGHETLRIGHAACRGAFKTHGVTHFISVIFSCTASALTASSSSHRSGLQSWSHSGDVLPVR